MPHQLRRIIAINIRNASDGNPSGRISELDPRGGVLAVGDNGVGKTTFLRLIPLFYGATPSQVLKGSGRTSMIKHTLPDPSSAVAYEYERESEGHLRTVVMYAKEGEDVPEFHIINGGFDESYFYDDTNQFVTRKEFLIRTRARNVHVTRLLQLNEYRSVILNERLSTKSAQELMGLAREHSLGPRPLRNLNQISAAMANEKINFRDLQNIVLERVAEDQATETKRQNVRELKQRKEDVNAWLERRGHMAEILKRKPDAERMKERVNRIKGLHLELCSLHVAVKAALTQAKADHTRLTGEREQQAKSFDDEVAALGTALVQAEAVKSAAFGDWSNLNAEVKRVVNRQNHFDLIDARALADRQSREESLKQRAADKERELDGLTAAVGSLKATHDERMLGIERSAQNQKTEISERMVAIKENRATKAVQLGNSKDDALLALHEPPRLAEIASERNVMAKREGEISQSIRNPVATARTMEDLEVARAAVEQCLLGRDEAKDKAGVCERAVDAARGESDESVRTTDALDLSLQEVRRSIDAHTAKLTPEPGSLLAFIRESDDPVWVHASKLIDENLIHRTDLSPAVLDLAPDAVGDEGDGSVVIGHASLQTVEVDTPAWFSMEHVRAQFDEANATAVKINEKLTKAQAQAVRSVDRLRQAESDHAQANALLTFAVLGLKAANDDKERLDRLVKEERQAAVGEAKEALQQLRTAVATLSDEEKGIRDGLAGERQAILSEFKRQTDALDAEAKRQTDALTGELHEVESRRLMDLANQLQDFERRLKGEGLDPERVNAVQGEITALRDQLSSIAANRHEVEAWKLFCDKELPYLESNQRELIRLQELSLDASKRHGDLATQRDALVSRAKIELDDTDARLKALRDNTDRLNELMDQKLKDFLDFVPSNAYTGRPLSEIEQIINTRRKALRDEDDKLHGEIKSLSNDFEKREGGPHDWLKLKRQELPDKQTRLEHEYRCLEARQLCDWFERTECGSYIDQLSSEMAGFFENASVFVSRLDTFDRLVQAFNSELGRALASAKHFERFKDLGVRVTSSVGQQAFLKVLRQMKDRSGGGSLMGRSYSRVGLDLPNDEDAALVREYREILQGDGGVLVNLSDQVRLECSLYENGKRRTITNEEEFRAISSNGNSALITAMFLMGFVQMIRGHSPVRLVWVTDELGRFDSGNVGAFLKTLALNDIDVICASPSVDPALARHFPRLSMFESTGAIFTTENHEQEVLDEIA